MKAGAGQRASHRRPLPLRATREATWREFSRNLESLFAGAQTSVLTDAETTKAWQSPLGISHKLMRHSEDGRSLILFISNIEKNAPIRAVNLQFNRKYNTQESKLAHIFARVFDQDLQINAARDSDELWISLQQSRFSRTIARFTTFSTETFLSWLRTMENATSLTYEGRPFSTHLLLTWQPEYVIGPAGGNFIGFSKPIQREAALLGEKWLRALTHSGTVALVAGKRQGIIGTLALDRSAIPPTNEPILHEDLAYLTSFIKGGVALITATSGGDLYVLFPAGATFVKRQGRWRYLNSQILLEKIASYVSKQAAASISTIALSLSFERSGALLGIIDDKDVRKAAPDHDAQDRSNAALRSLASKLQISNPAHQKLLRSAAGIDGAILFDKSGNVLDLACMISTPQPEELSRKGIQLSGGLVGARSTAARNCSVYGLAIKISDDGPISVFESGKLALELG